MILKYKLADYEGNVQLFLVWGGRERQRKGDVCASQGEHSLFCVCACFY